MKPIQRLGIKLDDVNAERVARNHDDRISQIAEQPAMHLTPLGEVTLEDGVETTIAHKLGREPLHVFLSPPRGGVTIGATGEVSSGNRAKAIVLKATGWGATITIDVSVM